MKIVNDGLILKTKEGFDISSVGNKMSHRMIWMGRGDKLEQCVMSDRQYNYYDGLGDYFFF